MIRKHANGTKVSITTVNGSTATPILNTVSPVGNQPTSAAIGCSPKCLVDRALNTMIQLNNKESPIANNATR